MGRCFSRPLTRDEAEEETETRTGRLRALLRRLMPRASSPFIDLDPEEGDDSQAEVSLHSKISQLQTQISELTDDRSRAEKELAALKQNCDELTAALTERDKTEDDHRNQIAQLENRISALTEDLALSRSEQEFLKQQHDASKATPHEQVAKLQDEISQREAKISELTEGRVIVERDLQQREETETALRSQIAQLEDEISQKEASLTASEESRSLAESALAQLQQQHDLLNKSCESPQAKVELSDLVNELYEVTDWFHFGLQLKVPFSQLMVIQRNNVQHDVLGKTTMLQTWLNTVGSEASWADIVAVLMRVRRRGLAKRLAKKYDVSLPSSDDTSLETLGGTSHSEETQSMNAQILQEVQSNYKKFDEQDKRMAGISASVEAAKIDRQTLYENTHGNIEAMEDGLVKLDSLAEREMETKEQLRSKGRELHYLQQLQHQMRKNEELKALVESKQIEIEQLQISLLETQKELESGRDEVLTLRRQLQQARGELEASCSRLKKLDGERAELQAEVNRERRKVEDTLIQKAEALSTEEPAHEMEYKHDQAMELLSESSGHEVRSRQDDSQREEQIRELLVKARKLESPRLSWRKCENAPEPLVRGSAAVDTDRHMAYFSVSTRVYAYEWQAEKWSRLCDCPTNGHTLAVVGGLLTAVGGVGQSGSPTNILLNLIGDASEMRWKEHFPPMPTKRMWTAVICSGKYLVAMGGVREPSEIGSTTVEVLNTETQGWFLASNLPFSVPLASATIVGDKLYLAGGNRKSQKVVLTCSLVALLQSCQPHPARSQSPPLWQQVADAPANISTCVTLNGQLVAVGGYDDHLNPTDAVYAYNPDTDSWNMISHMNIARRNCLAVVLPGDRLMVVGGYTPYGVNLQTASVEIGT